MTDPAIGSLVTLKSGGPIMTITKLLRRGYVRCEWFDSIGEPWLASYPRSTLEVCLPPERKEH